MVLVQPVVVLLVLDLEASHLVSEELEFFNDSNPIAVASFVVDAEEEEFHRHSLEVIEVLPVLRYVGLCVAA